MTPTMLNEGRTVSRGAAGRQTADFTLAIDDQRASELYDSFDSASPMEQDQYRSALRNWAETKLAEEQSRNYDDLTGIYADVNRWWEDSGGGQAEDEVKYGAANRKFIAAQTNQSAREMGDLYPSERDRWFLQNMGKAPKTESEAFELVRKSFETKKQSDEALDLITGDVALALFDQVNKGAPVDIPTLMTKWKEENAEILDALPEGWEARTLQAADQYYTETESMLRDHGPVLQNLYNAIQKATGRYAKDPAQEGAFGDRFTNPNEPDGMDEVVNQLTALPPDVRDRGYAAILMAAKREGLDDKSFSQMLGEGLGRIINPVRTMATFQQEMAAQERLRLLESEGPVYRDPLTGGLMGEATGALMAQSGQATRQGEPLSDEDRAAAIEEARREVVRFDVIRELRDLADNRFDPVKSSSKNTVGKFVQDIALLGPQQMAYTAMAVIPIAGPLLTYTAVTADEYNQLRLQGWSAEEAKPLAAASGVGQTIIEVFGARLIFGQSKIFNKFAANLQAKIMNPARFGTASSLGIRAGLVYGAENVTEGFQDLTTPAFQELFNDLGAEYPEVNWDNVWQQWKDSRLEVAAAVIVPVMAGHISTMYVERGLRGEQEWRKKYVYGPLGMSQDEIRNIEDGATPEEKSQRFSQIVQDMPDERKQKIKDSAASQAEIAMAAQQDPTLPTMEVQKDDNGKTAYIVRDEQGKETYRSTKQEAAEEAYRMAVMKSTAAQFAQQKIDLQSFKKWWLTQDPKRKANEQRVINDSQQQTTAAQKLQILEQAGNKQGIEELHRRIAQSPYAGTPYEQIFILGEASVEQVGEMVFKSVIALNPNSDLRSAREEMHHTAVRIAAANGRADENTMRGWLEASERVFAEKGLNIALPRADMTDIVESMAVVQEAFENERISADVEMSLPQEFVAYIKRMIQVFVEVLKRGKALREAFDAGALPSEFEAFLAETTGVADQTVVDRSREKTAQEVAPDGRGADGLTDDERYELQQELMAEAEQDAADAISDGAIDILAAIRESGGLPSKTSRRVYQYAGELQRIREAQKGGNAIGVKGTFNLFRKNAPDLDALIKDLQIMGFTQITTPSELFDVVERRMNTGRPIYGYEAAATAQAVENYSIAALGESFPQFSGRPQEAIDHLMIVKQGYVPAAWNHPQIGEVDLIYGGFTGRAAGSGGLAKIAALRPEIIATLGEEFQSAEVVSENENTVQLVNNDKTYVVRKTYFDQQMRWLLTAYKKDGEPASETIDTADPDVSVERRDDKLSPQGSQPNLDAQDAEVKGQAASGEYPSTTENYSIGLVSLHKLSEEKLRFADRMGGLAVPSIAVTKTGTPIKGFGEITLVGGQELGDPSLNPVYDADAYTARFPKPEYKKVKMSVAQKLVNFFRPFDARYASYYGDKVADVVWDNAVNTPNPDDTINKLTRSNVAKAAYLESAENVTIEPVMRPKKERWGLTGTASMQQYITDGQDISLIGYNDTAERKKLTDAILAAMEEQVADKSPEVQKIMRDGMMDNIEEDTGLLMFQRMQIVQQDIQSYGQTEVDAEATGKALDTALSGKEAAFTDWVESTIRDMYAPPRIKVGGKWEPYTLENIARVMSSGRIVGAEKTMAFGEGPARAAAARRFSSLTELRNAAEGLASEEDVEAAREKSREVVSAWRDKVIEFYKWQDAWDALDNAMQALARFYKAGDISERGMQRALRSMDFVDVPAAVAKEGVAAARALMNTPVPYFESKPQRVVRLTEFKAAIVPKSVSVEAVNILLNHGLEVVSVETSGDVSSPELQQALQSVSADISYSISTQSEIDRVGAALNRLDRDPLERVKIYEKAQEKFLRVMADNRDMLAGMQDGDLAQMRRTQILQALGELDGIISVLPPEVRSKIGGYTQLAKVDPMDVFKGDQKVSEVRGMSGAIISAWMREGLNIGEAQKKTELPAGYRAERNLDPTRADRAIADVFIQRINRINEALEQFLRDEYNTAAVELFKRAKPQRSGAGEKPKGKLGADVHDLFDKLKEATEWSAEEAQAYADGQWARIENGELNPYEETHAMMAAQMVPLFADWANADSSQRAAAVTMGKDVLNRAYKGEQQRIIAQRTKRGYDRTDLSKDAGVSAEDDKARQDALKRENSLPSKWESAMLNLLNFDQVLRYVFGNDSKIARQISDRQRKADNAKSDDIAALSDEWAAFLSELGGGEMQGQQLLFELSRMDEQIDGVSYSQNQLIAISMMWMQPKGRQHMEGFLDSDGQPAGKWHYNQDFVNKAEKLLRGEAKAIRQYLLDKYDAEYEAINKVYRKVYGLNLPKNQFYSPLVVESIRAPAQAGIDPVTGGVFAAGANSPSALRSRGGAIAQPVFRDAVQTYFGHMLQMAHWKAYAEFNGEVSALLGHRDTRNVVKGKAGEQAATVMNNWLQYFQQGGNKDAANHLAINQMINRMTGNFATMALFGRISTLALQVTQLGAASAKMPVGAYLSRFGKLMSGRLGWKTALDSAYIQRRIKDMPPAVALAMQGLRSEKPNAIREAARRIGSLISGFDGFFTAGTYAIVYDYQLSQASRNGMGGQEAADYAREATERIVDEIAQPTRAGARSIFEINSTNPVARAVWAFSSESRKNLGLGLYAGAKGSGKDLGKAVFYVLVLNGLVGTIIRNAFRDLRDDDDEETFDEKNWGWNRMAAMLISDPLYGFPVVGEAVESAIFNAFGVYTPSGPLFDVAPAVPAVKRLAYDYPMGEQEAEFRDIVRDVNRILSTAGLFNNTIAGAAAISNLVKDTVEVGDNVLNRDE